MATSAALSGWPIARIYGITVRIHASWLLIFFLLAWSLADDILPLSNLADGGPWWDGMAQYNEIARYQHKFEIHSFREAASEMDIQLWPEWHYWMLGVIGSVGLFVCVLAHEISHSLVARRAGIPVEGITLFIFGGVSQLREEAGNPADEFRIAAAGPAMSVVIGLACGALYYGLGSAVPAEGRSLLYYFTFINLMLAAFNLLPGFPLDGGRLLRAWLWKRYGDFARATQVASWWGKAIGTGFIALGLVEFWLGFVAGSISMGPLWLVLIGWFLRHAAQASGQQLAMKNMFAGLTVRDVIQPAVVTVPPDLTLEQAVDDYFYTHKFRSFPVLEGDRLAGVISLRDLQAVPRADWPRLTVRQAMHQVREENLVHPSDDLAIVFRKMAEEDKGHLPVVEAGRLCGIVTRHDIMTLIQLKTDLGGRARTGPR
jgi:Zn-dependent protease/CBS domain-containing protein